MKLFHAHLRSAVALYSFVLAFAFLSSAAYAQNQCASSASLDNPATQTGLIAWWKSLWQRELPGHDDALQTARPGIGGTGIDNGGMGGTGIVGVITGFASVCVNGVEVHLDRRTPIVSGGQPVSIRDLAVGQMVAVRARGLDDEVSALRITVLHSVVGPVASVDPSAGTLETLGQTVRAVYPGELSGLKPGDWVQISGYRNQAGTIAATRIEAIAPATLAQLTGPVEKLEAGGFWIQGTKVQLDNATARDGLAVGTEVSVRGRWDGNSLLAHSVDSEPTRKAVGSVERVVLEGFVHGVQGAQLSLGGRTVTLDSNVQFVGPREKALAVNQRVQVTGHVGVDQQITVNRVVVRSDSDRRGSGRSKEGRRDRAEGADDSGKDSSRSGSDDGGKSGSDSSGSGKSSSGSSGSGSSGSSGSGSSGGSGKGK